MAKPKPDQPPKPDQQSQPADTATQTPEAAAADSEAQSPGKPESGKAETSKPEASKPEASKPAAAKPVVPAAKSPKKSSSPARAKKQSGAAAKSNSGSGSLLPSADKLEQLKAAVTAAGSAENLLQILQHVEQAGGLSEVTESIEAYQVLKTVMEE